MTNTHHIRRALEIEGVLFTKPELSVEGFFLELKVGNE